jgi:hypothetical protein
MCRLPRDLYVLYESKGLSQVEAARYCPICGGRLHVDGGRLLCDRHGEMRVYVEAP